MQKQVQEVQVRQGSVREFHERAARGERLAVGFLGGSLTWGAQATDPQKTSYRARICQRFTQEYPEAHFRFVDAAIGGTGSRLAVFRLERDVLRHGVALVFLDFTVNDDPYSPPQIERLAAYESLLRCLLDAGVAVVPLLFPSRDDLKTSRPARPLDAKHLELAGHYGLLAGDVVTLAQQLADAGEVIPEELWDIPEDGTHPGDQGYALFARGAWEAYSRAVESGAPARAGTRAPLYPSIYMENVRQRFSLLGELPAGWRVGQPNRVAAWYDALMSRWLDDVVVAGADAEPLRCRFRGESVLLFGEATLASGRYQVKVDGKIQCVGNATAKRFGGNMHHVRVVAEGLGAGVWHDLELKPLLTKGKELRLESLCVAGAGASVERH